MKIVGDQSGASHRSRIPIALQAVFLASNRGANVDKPPPEQAAYKVFPRNWMHQKKFNLPRSSHESSNTKDIQQVKNSENISAEEFSRSLSRPDISPQIYLDAMLRSRGYSTKRYNTLHSGYYNRPTPLQQASYDVYMIQLVRQNRVAEFSEVISCGISPNPCNAYGESIVHMVCRHRNLALLQAMMTAGCDLQVADDHGRTPLHDACWAPEPAWELVETILRIDSRLLHMMDIRGNVPLDYVRQSHWSQWIDFLESLKDDFWPNNEEATSQNQGPPPLSVAASNSRPIPDPKNALSLEKAAMVASGRLKPVDAVRINDEEASCMTDAMDFDDDDDEFSTCSESDDLSSYDEYDEDDLQELLDSLPLVRRQ